MTLYSFLKIHNYLLLIEIWRKIFTFLDSKGLIACYQTAKYWQHELESQKTEFMMGHAFSVLSEKGYLKEEDVYKCRLVCPSWRSSMDSYLLSVTHDKHTEVHEDNYVSLFEKPWHYYRIGLNPQIYVKSLSKLENLMTTYPEEKNPFITRSITYCESGKVDKVSQLRATFERFLERFGAHILHCDLSVCVKIMGTIYKCRNGGRVPLDGDECQTDPETLYNVVRSFLIHIPNLKTLKLRAFAINCSIENRHLMTPSMKELIKAFPLPPLRDLVTLKLDTLVNPLETAVMQQYNHVEKLQVSGKFDTSFPECIGTIRRERLKELTAFTNCEKDFICLERMVSNFPPPLNKLKLELGCENFKLICKVANCFESTLHHLKISSDENAFYDFKSQTPINLGSSRLTLPYLETLAIRSTQLHFNSLDFLEHCRALKHLDMDTCIEDWKQKDILPADENLTIIDFQGFYNRMYESNVWIILPDLERFKLKIQNETEIKCDDYGDGEYIWNEEKFDYSKKEYATIQKANRSST